MRLVTAANWTALEGVCFLARLHDRVGVTRGDQADKDDGLVFGGKVGHCIIDTRSQIDTYAQRYQPAHQGDKKDKYDTSSIETRVEEREGSESMAHDTFSDREIGAVNCENHRRLMSRRS